ncbi:MAG: phosphopentomutase, partial [Armatimonadetes bacterium]|nr:phosphopentomutase [Armatimonadota bacterium]
MTIGRAIVIVLDSVGVGELPDAADYGDAGANTLAHVAEVVGGLNLPNLEALGLGNVTAISGVAPRQSPIGCFGKMAEVSIGKDTATGHWELMGVITSNPFPTYPNGFPDEIIKEFESRIGRRTIGNKVASGTEIIAELGDEHLRTGCPIVYSSVDSVFQIACHEQVIPLDELYKMCETARSILVAPHDIQRVIARPFVGSMGHYTRTPRRRDYALPPPHDTLLDLLSKAGGQVIGIGKIEDLFSGRGVSVSHHTSGNLDGIDRTVAAVSTGQGDLIFTNLAEV